MLIMLAESRHRRCKLLPHPAYAGLAGSVLGRMNFKAWVIFCPVWMTCVYTVGAFSLWGGGWLATMGAVDFSGGYVIHLAAGTSGFVAAWVIGPRLQADRDNCPPNNLLVALAGAGILWLGWNGFNGGDPYFANANAGAAVLNTNVSTATALMVWTIMDTQFSGKPSIVGAINGMIAGLVGITPAAGYVDGYGALIIGVCAGIIPWLAMNKLQTSALMNKVDDTLSVFSTHGVAGLHGRPLDRRAGQSRHASLHRHRKGRAGHQRDGLVLWQFHAVQISGDSRALHHRV